MPRTSSASEAGLITCTGVSTMFGGKPSRSPAIGARPSAGSRQSDPSKITSKAPVERWAGRRQGAGPSRRTHQDNRPRPTSKRVAGLVGRAESQSTVEERSVAKKRARSESSSSEEEELASERVLFEPVPPSYDPPTHLQRQQSTTNKVGSKGIARVKLRQAFLRFFEAGGHRDEALRVADEAWAARGAGVTSFP